jgi:hypothetical protein
MVKRRSGDEDDSHVGAELQIRWRSTLQNRPARAASAYLKARSFSERGLTMRYVVLGLCMFAAACAELPSAPTSPSTSSIDGAAVTIGGAAVTQARGGSELPFQGTLQATETADGALHHLVGTGEATHLGRFTLTSEFTVTTPPPRASGTATWTAANGDEIFTTVIGQGVVTFPVLAVVETHTITGGTGRFAGTSGSILLERSINLQTLISSASITGTISLALGQ